MKVLGIAVVSVLLVVLVTLVTMTMAEELDEYRRRRWARRRSVEAEWRIHQIGGDARARMWDEVTRHHESGG